MYIPDQIQIYRAVLASLKNRRTASLSTRVAIRFVEAYVVSRGANELAYAQTLNGAFGFGDKYNADWRKTQKKIFAEMQENPDKYQDFSVDWLTPANYDIFKPLHDKVKASKNVSSADADDILGLIMTGVSNTGVRKAFGYHRAGEILSKAILSGASTPKTRSGNSVVGKVIGFSGNATTDVLRKLKRQRGDQNMDDVTVRSTKPPPSRDIDVALSVTPSEQGDASYLEFKEDFIDALANSKNVEGMMGTLSENRSSSAARKVLEEAEKFWRQDRSLEKVKKKDKHRGRDLMLAYVDLLRKGHADPRMDEITSVFRSIPTQDDEVMHMRAATPTRNFHNDIKKAKALGFASFGKALQRKKRLVEDLTKWVFGKQANMKLAKRVANKWIRIRIEKKAASRPLHQIAQEIRQDWGSKVNYAAKPYLDAMMSLGSMKDMYGYDPASQIVAYFLSNSRSWRGPVAKAIKAELNKMLKTGSKTARHPKGPMSKEDKEKLMEENPKFREMNEEHGDKFKNKEAAKKVDWTDPKNVERNFMNSFEKLHGGYEGWQDGLRGNEEYLINIEISDWNREEPGEEGSVSYDIVLKPSVDEISLRQGRKELGSIHWDLWTNPDPRKVFQAVEKLERQKAPRVKFFRYDSPSLPAPPWSQRASFKKKAASMAKHIRALQKLFPKSMIKDSREFNGRSGGIWTGFGEDGTSNYSRSGWPDEHHPKLQKYMDKNGLFGEWNDPGTLMVYPI